MKNIKIFLLFLFLIIFTLTGCCFLPFASTSGVNQTDTLQINGKLDLMYLYEGTANTVFLTYTNSGGGTEQKDNVINNGYILFKDFPATSFMYISAQNLTETGTVRVKIMVNNIEWKKAESEGAYVIATASGYYFLE